MFQRLTKKLIIISILLFTVYGCTLHNTQDKKTAHSDSLNKQLNKSFDEFYYSSVHLPLTEEIIDSISDEKLAYAVFSNLLKKLPSDYTMEYETVDSWNKYRQAIYMIWILEGEVNNGGFNQFYFNSSGQYAKKLPDALRLIGAFRTAALTEKANSIYENQKADITRHQDGSLEGFSKSYKNNPLNLLDDAFYDLSKIENLEKLEVAFIRKHKKQFTDQ